MIINSFEIPDETIIAGFCGMLLLWNQKIPQMGYCPD
jgi:hypothetical protein